MASYLSQLFLFNCGHELLTALSDGRQLHSKQPRSSRWRPFSQRRGQCSKDGQFAGSDNTVGSKKLIEMFFNLPSQTGQHWPSTLRGLSQLIVHIYFSQTAIPSSLQVHLQCWFFKEEVNKTNVVQSSFCHVSFFRFFSLLSVWQPTQTGQHSPSGIATQVQSTETWRVNWMLD